MSYLKETCRRCGEEISENELESPMGEHGVCDDCVDDEEGQVS